VPGRHTIQHRAAWIGGGKVAAIGQQRRAQPGDPALPYGPCCLARFVDAAPPWRPAHDQENRKIRLAASLHSCRRASLRAGEGTQKCNCAINSRVLPLACVLGPGISRGVVGVWMVEGGHCVLCGVCAVPAAAPAMTLTCSMQACI
jgi:hypothetical protein